MALYLVRYNPVELQHLLVQVNHHIIYTSHQTNGGTNIHRYIRGKWANNHTHHEWNVFEDNGNNLGFNSFGITVGQNTSSASGKLTISETYGSGSLSNRAVSWK